MAARLTAPPTPASPPPPPHRPLPPPGAPQLPADSPGLAYAQLLRGLAASDPPAFICHYYNYYFAHTAGGRMIGSKVRPAAAPLPPRLAPPPPRVLPGCRTPPRVGLLPLCYILSAPLTPPAVRCRP